MPESSMMELDAGSNQGLRPYTAPKGRKKSLMIGCGLLLLVVVALIAFSAHGTFSGHPQHGIFGFQCTDAQKQSRCSACSDDRRCTQCHTGFELTTMTSDSGSDGEGSEITTCIWKCDATQLAAHCTVCQDYQTCTQCAPGYRLNAGACPFDGCLEEQRENGCVECTDPNTCTSCREGFNHVDGKTCVYKGCSESQRKKECTACKNETHCTACHSPWKVHAGRCLDECFANGENDFTKELGLAPKIRNGFIYPQMCVDEEEANFFGIGDWGGFVIGSRGKNEGMKEDKDPNAKYGSAGDLGAYKWDPEVDGKAQKFVADQMNELAKTRKPRFVINVGDSFYWGGFEDIGCGGDPKKGWNNWRWKRVFMDLYDIPHPTNRSLQVPWFSVLGNHDYGGMHMDSGWDHQVYFTYKPGSYWRMPGMWWEQTVRFHHFHIDLFMVDGNYFDAFPIGMVPNSNICNRKDERRSDGVCEAEGLETLRFGKDCDFWFRRRWDEQMKWLEERFNKSRAHYTIVVAHYPGNCGHPTLQKMLTHYGVDVCIVGHEHQQSIKQRKKDERGQDRFNLCHREAPCDDVPLEITTGGGGGINAAAPPKAVPDQYGFVDFKVTKEKLSVNIVDFRGDKKPAWVAKRKLKPSRGEVSK